MTSRKQNPPHSSVPVGGDDGVIDHAGKAVEQATLPQQYVALAGVTGGTQQPVVAGILVLEDVRLAGNHHPLEPGTGLGVRRHPHLPVRPRQQILERVPHISRRDWPPRPFLRAAPADHRPPHHTLSWVI